MSSARIGLLTGLLHVLLCNCYAQAQDRLLPYDPSESIIIQDDQDVMGTANDKTNQDDKRLPGSDGRDLQIEQDPKIGQDQSKTTSTEGENQNSTDARQLDNFEWLDQIKVGYDKGFVIASETELDLDIGSFPFRMDIRGWGQLRHTFQDSAGRNADRNEFQLARGRIQLAGSAFTSDFDYFVQFDGRSSSGDDVRLLDYYLSYDVGHHSLGMDEGEFGLRTGRWKMPFSMSRYLSGKEFEYTDRSMSSIFFDVNRSLGWGLYGQSRISRVPMNWEVALFNGLVTGGAETGSSGDLDNNFAVSGRALWYPTGEWGMGELADFEGHCQPATRVGAGFANSTINRLGSTEFTTVRVVDSGKTLSSLLPSGTLEYNVSLYAVDFSMKYRGYSFTTEYYFRQIADFRGVPVPTLFDHGYWLQLGKFVVPRKIQLLGRWSRVMGNSGTLGGVGQSSDELSGGFAWYFRDQHAKFVFDATYLNGATINSSSLDMSPGDIGWLYRSQIQFAF